MEQFYGQPQPAMVGRSKVFGVAEQILNVILCKVSFRVSTILVFAREK